MPNTTSSKQVLLSVKAYGFLILEIVRELTLVELRRTQLGGIEKKVLDCSCVSHGVDIEGCDKTRMRNTYEERVSKGTLSYHINRGC